VRRPVPSPWASVRIDNYRNVSQSITRWKKLHTVRCQAQHNDGKYDLHGTKAEDDSWSHHRVCRGDIKCRVLLGAGQGGNFASGSVVVRGMRGR
jgi:hypothetical protein